MIPFLSDSDFTLYLGDAVEALAELEPDSVDCVVTSPPYYALRDYGVDGQIGAERTIAEYLASLVEVFRGVRRALKPTGTVWLNLGDSFASKQNSGTGWDSSGLTDTIGRRRDIQVAQEAAMSTRRDRYDLPQKNLLGLPWRLAFALQDDGWWLRQCNIWSKPNTLPDSATDRPGTAHEYVFMLTKSARYFYDLDAVKVPAKWERWGAQTSRKEAKRHDGHDGPHVNGGHMRKLSPSDVLDEFGGLRNLRSVWEIPTTPNTLAVCEDCESFFTKSADAETHRKRTGHEVTQHFAAFPKKLVETCILAGSSAHGCCPECGAPWERETETEYKHHENWFGSKQDARHSRGSAGTSYDEPIATRTIGWHATCECGNEPVPSVVMDPFMGSGTTAVVAREMERRCIGVELRPAFARMSAWRLQQLSLLA